MLGIKPDFDLLSRYLSEYRNKNEMTNSEYEELLLALNKDMPTIYNDFIERCKKLGISQEYKYKIDWKRIEKLLPSSYEGKFSINPMINNNTSYEMIKLLRTIEIYIQSGLSLLSIINRLNNNGIKIQNITNLFKKIILTKLIIETPGKINGKIDNLLDTEDLVDKCLSLLNQHYNQNPIVEL